MTRRYFLATLGAVGCVVLFTGAAVAEMHVFTQKDGRALEAEIVDHDASRGEVMLKRPDGSEMRVKTDGFVAKVPVFVPPIQVGDDE